MHSRENQTEQTSFQIQIAHAGMRLDAFLAQELSQFSRTHIAALIEQGCASVNGRPAKKNYRLFASDKVILDAALSTVTEKQAHIDPENIPISIIWEDEHFVVINKPAGLVVHPGNGNSSGTLVNGLCYHFDSLSTGSETDRPGIVHRLDKDTTGLLLVAKTDSAHTLASEMFANRTIYKEYIGIAIGINPLDHDIIEAPLGRSRRDPLRVCVRNDGKPSTTEYWLMAYRSTMSVLRFKLHTGRTHQIRVHCAHKQFPLIQDSLYGGGKDAVLKVEPMERPFVYSVYKSISRQALHAAKLSFVHPITNEPLVITAPLPDDMALALSFFDVKKNIDEFYENT